jgi:hypothetical protein
MNKNVKNRSNSYPEFVVYRDSTGKELSFYLKGNQLYLKKSEINNDFSIDIKKLLDFYIQNTKDNRRNHVL